MSELSGLGFSEVGDVAGEAIKVGIAGEEDFGVSFVVTSWCRFRRTFVKSAPRPGMRENRR